MSQISPKLRQTYDGLMFFCPGCTECHHIRVGGLNDWTWDGDIHAPTFSPSILATGKSRVLSPDGQWIGGWIEGPDGKALDKRCHSFVRAGQIEFLPDCTHGLAAKTVPMPPLPDWLQDETRGD